MQVKLPPQLKQFIRTGIKSGRFKNTSDAICAALRLFEQRDRLVSAVASDSAVVLGALSGQDIEATAFLVLMQAAKSAQEDLKAIMKSVKAINSAKSAQRDLIAKTGYDIAENVGPVSWQAFPEFCRARCWQPNGISPHASAVPGPGIMRWCVPRADEHA